MESTTLTYQPEQLLVIVIVMLLVGVALGAYLAVAVYKELVAPPDDLVKEELAAMRSAQRLATAASRTRQAMRREGQAFQPAAPWLDEVDGSYYDEGHSRAR